MNYKIFIVVFFVIILKHHVVLGEDYDEEDRSEKQMKFNRSNFERLY